MAVAQGPSAYQNRLLSLLSAEDRALLDNDLEQVELPRRFVIAEPNETIKHAYFVEAGLGSMVVRSPEGLEAEAGMFGRDGFAPVATVMGFDRTPHSHFMQIGGSGYRIETSKLEEAVCASSSLQRLLLRYVGVYGVQTSFTALSNAVHQVHERLARWILMSHDRSGSDDFPLTHEFLAVMLAVRRPTVTAALHVLEGSGFIRTDRGYLMVINRRALEQFAGDAYGQPEDEYRRLIGPL